MITPEYQAQLKQMHANSKWGTAGKTWIPDVVQLIVRFGLVHPTVLDFGAGERSFSKTMAWAMPHVNVTDYDPGMPHIDVLPQGTFDIVLCTDVMEHVEPQFIGKTIQQIRSLTRVAAIFNIACGPAKEFLPDGRNAHLSIHPPAWWQEKIQQLWRETEIINHRKSLVIYASK